MTSSRLRRRLAQAAKSFSTLECFADLVAGAAEDDDVSRLMAISASSRRYPAVAEIISSCGRKEISRSAVVLIHRAMNRATSFTRSAPSRAGLLEHVSDASSRSFARRRAQGDLRHAADVDDHHQHAQLRRRAVEAGDRLQRMRQRAWRRDEERRGQSARRRPLRARSQAIWATYSLAVAAAASSKALVADRGIAGASPASPAGRGRRRIQQHQLAARAAPTAFSASIVWPAAGDDPRVGMATCRRRCRRAHRSAAALTS